MKLKECFWLWGQDTMSHQRALGNAKWKLPDGNQLDPAAGGGLICKMSKRCAKYIATA